MDLQYKGDIMIEKSHIIGCNTTNCKFNIQSTGSCKLEMIIINEAECDSFQDVELEKWNEKENN